MARDRDRGVAADARIAPGVRFRALVRATGEAASRAVDDLTPGQRWTAALAAGLGVVVLAFGLPAGTPRLIGGPTGADAATGPAHRATATRASASSSSVVPAPRVTDVSGAPVAQSDAVMPATPVDATNGAPGADGAAPRTVVALVQPSSVDADPASDHTMATAFFASAGITPHVVPIADVASTCRAARGAGRVAVASGHVDDALRRCLAEAGLTVVSFDDGGTLVSGGGVALSTRRGVELGLLDVAARLRRSLGHAVAIVADARFRSAVEHAAPALRARGVHVVANAFLDDRDPAGSIDPQSVVDVWSKGADTVVFATSVARQAAWGSQFAALHPAPTFVVADAADSFTNASYPAVFDGALAATAVQYPWYTPADRAVTAARQRCEQRWAAARTAPVALGSDELVRALSWCQGVDAAARLVAAPAGAAGAEKAITARPVVSPLTSPFAALRDPWSFGPGAVATARWSASCACWATSTSFTPEANRA